MVLGNISMLRKKVACRPSLSDQLFPVLLFGVILIAQLNTIMWAQAIYSHFPSTGTRVWDDETSRFEFKRVTKCHDFFYTLPECVDHPEGYNCDCGPGFFWNSERCISAGVDSKMTFARYDNSFAYSILERRTLPTNFTLAVWIRPEANGTVVSLKRERPVGINYLRVILLDRPAGLGYWPGQGGHETQFQVKFELAGTTWTLERYLKRRQWVQLVWTHHISGGQRFNYGPRPLTTVQIYLNGSGVTRIDHINHIKTRGELILGQSSRDDHKRFDSYLAFNGDMAHFNLWNRSFTPAEVESVYRDCSLMYCGNVVQWSDFRFGTRGSLQLRWPSGIIKKNCLSKSDLHKSCDVDCSRRIGAQCKAEITENIQWPRTKALNTTFVLCPGISQIQGEEPKYAERFCQQNFNQEGQWADPQVSDCISKSHHSLLKGKKEMRAKFRNCSVLREDLWEDIKSLLHELVNLTSHTAYSNPVDISIVVDMLEFIVEEKKNIGVHCSDRHKYINPGGSGIQNSKANGKQLRYLFEAIVNITDNLLSKRNEEAWNATRPAGVEARKLANLLDTFYAYTLHSLVYIIMQKSMTHSEASLFLLRENIIVKLNAYSWKGFKGEALPEKSDFRTPQERRMWDRFGTIAVQMNTFQHVNSSATMWPPETIGLVTAVYPRLNRYLPHHIHTSDYKKSTGSILRDRGNVNSAIFHIKVFLDREEADMNLDIPIRNKFFYLNNFNISNVQCVQLSSKLLNKPPSFERPTPWNTEGCWLEKTTERYCICSCKQTGLLAVTTDMYDVNWKKGDKPNPLLELPSYIGCTVSAVICLISCIMLTYLRTSSNTASIHKNFSLAIVGGQMSFMFGIDKFYHELLCHAFAILLHYFFLACFSWLMNEAFNLYIVITYAAHSHGDHTDGSMWRYYLLGWIVPGVLVGAFVGANSQDYYAKDMCWINWDHIWLFTGPAISIVIITILVLIFTAKEHHESSYTKNEEANKAIVIQTKALWTQVILLSIAWSFAFVSVRMRGVIIKYLYGTFNCLQGAFFIVFYFLLNDEVQSIHNDKNKQQTTADENSGLDDILALDTLFQPEEDAVTAARRVSSNVGHIQTSHQALPSDQVISEKPHEVEDSALRRWFRGRFTGPHGIRGRIRKGGRGDDNSGYELVTSV